jgi:hypothetical protein
MADLVPNPRRERLQEALDTMLRDGRYLGGALKRPDQHLGTRRVWVGGGAPAFQEELGNRSTSLSRTVNGLLDEIQRRLNAMPKMVTKAEAQGRWAAPP